MELTKQDLQELLALFKSGYISMGQYEGVLAEKRWTTSTKQAKEKFLSDGNQFNENDTGELDHQVEKAKVCQFDWQQKVKNALKSTTEFQRSIFVLFTGVLIGGVLFSGSPSLKTQNMDKSEQVSGSREVIFDFLVHKASQGQSIFELVYNLKKDKITSQTYDDFSSVITH